VVVSVSEECVSSLFRAEDRDISFLRNVGNHLLCWYHHPDGHIFKCLFSRTLTIMDSHTLLSFQKCIMIQWWDYVVEIPPYRINCLYRHDSFSEISGIFFPDLVVIHPRFGPVISYWNFIPSRCASITLWVKLVAIPGQIQCLYNCDWFLCYLLLAFYLQADATVMLPRPSLL
jgi:hypothetical protein